MANRSSNTLTSLTQLEGTSSGGPFRSGSEDPWDQVRLMLSEDEDDLWGADFFGPVVTHNGREVFWLGRYGHRANAEARLAALMLVCAIPEVGLEETVSTLRGLYEFYALEPPKALPRPTFETVEARIAP